MRIGDCFDGLDPLWRDHGDRVGSLADLVADAFELSTRSRRHLVDAAILHDVGKAHIDDRVLRKPSALTQQEWAIVRAHPRIGFDVLRGAVEPEIAQMVLYHHERYDGFGYPHGIAGAQVPLGARILATVDAFDAMVTERPYSAAIPVEHALAELHRCAGSQFDPDVVEIVGWVLESEFATHAVHVAV